jgi:hypothetical protein
MFRSGVDSVRKMCKFGSFYLTPYPSQYMERGEKRALAGKPGGLAADVRDGV